MSSFQFNTAPNKSFFQKAYGAPQDTGSPSGIVSRKTPSAVTADLCGTGSPFGSSVGGSGQQGSMIGQGSFGAGYQTDRYNPTFDRLEEGSIVEDWIARDASGINQMLRRIYLRDPIAGPAIDLIKTLPWSDYSLIGMKDPAVRRIFEDSLTNLSIVEVLPEISCDFLMLGRFCASLIFDDKEGVWKDWIGHDADFLRLTPIPVKGFEPKIDLVPSPAQKKFVNSTDPRDIAALKTLPNSLIQNLVRGGYVPLDPLNTLFLPRRTTMSDRIGTSILSRVLVFWALEKALINSTMTAARRRTKAILHVKAGTENWEPETFELQNIAGLFMQADEDPVGAVVVTRTGVEAQEVRGPEHWKLSDEWQFLSEGKMRALGINDSFLSGDATYQTMEAAMSVFIESLRVFRTSMTHKIFYKKLFPLLCKVHGFYKTSKADLDAHIMKPQKLSLKKALEIDDKDLVMPTIHWSKELKPEADMAYLDILAKMEEKGLPVTARDWAAAGGFNLDAHLGMTDDDIEVKAKIAKWKIKLQELAPQTPEGGTEMPQVMSRLNTLPIWNKKDEFMGLPKNRIAQVIANVTSEENRKKLISPNETMNLLSEYTEGNKDQVEIVGYLMKRAGISHTKLPINGSFQRKAAEHLNSLTNGKYDRKIVGELLQLKRITDGDATRNEKFDAKHFEALMAKSKDGDKIPVGSGQLYSGL